MVSLSLFEEELDVVWTALNNYSDERRESARLYERCSSLTGHVNQQFISSLLKEAEIADKLRRNITRLVLDLVTD